MAFTKIRDVKTVSPEYERIHRVDRHGNIVFGISKRPTGGTIEMIHTEWQCSCGARATGPVGHSPGKCMKC